MWIKFSELVALFLLFSNDVQAVQRVAKPVVFSYSIADTGRQHRQPNRLSRDDGNIQPRPPENIPGEYHDNNRGPTTTGYYDRGLPQEKTYFGGPSSQPTPYSYDEDVRHYSTVSPIYDRHSDGSNYPIGTPSPQTPFISSPDYDISTIPSNTERFPNYHPTNIPYTPDYTTRLTRGSVTYTPRPNFDYGQPSNDNEFEVGSTTPIVEFEPVKQMLPTADEYPPPKPEYITIPSDDPKLDEEKQHEDNVHNPRDQQEIVGKVLQHPKFFYYSGDLEDDSEEDRVNRDDAPEKGGTIHGNRRKNDEQYTKSGGQNHYSDHKASAGSKGDKGYKDGHEYTKQEKGHHDKEVQKGKYKDEKGQKGELEEEGGHYGEHHQAEDGKKSAKYDETGEHKKGHSTKGEHNIHKKDEYLKKYEFYDEHHEGGDHEKRGSFAEAHGRKKGGKAKKGHHKSFKHKLKKGKKGHYEKGGELGHRKGHNEAKAYDAYHKNYNRHGKKGGHKDGKKWGYSSGRPHSNVGRRHVSHQ